MLAEEHYAEHKGKPFFSSLLNYIMGEVHYPDRIDLRRVIAIVYQGPDAVHKIRDIAGPTNPHVARDTKPGCIRALGTSVQVKDSDGNLVGDRMDNLIHASANQEDAEREIKLWFKPHDIPTPMHPYATDVCKEHYYYTNGKLTTDYTNDSICILAPGNVAWESDLSALRQIAVGENATLTLEAISAKYLVNEDKENV
jgi:nucleoside-diphosphate kinase